MILTDAQQSRYNVIRAKYADSNTTVIRAEFLALTDKFNAHGNPGLDDLDWGTYFALADEWTRWFMSSVP